MPPDLSTEYLGLTLRSPNVASVAERAQISLAGKIGPYFSSLPNFACRVVEAGANGRVLFDRFPGPEGKLENRTNEAHPERVRASAARLAWRWLGVLREQLVSCSLTASSGIRRGIDVLKALAVGTDVVMVTSAKRKRRLEHLQSMQAEMVEWLSMHDDVGVGRPVGSMSQENCGSPAILAWANFASTLACYLDHVVLSHERTTT